MKDNARRVTVYLNEDNCDYLEERKEKKGISYSDTVNNALVNYRNSKIQKEKSIILIKRIRSYS